MGSAVYSAIGVAESDLGEWMAEAMAAVAAMADDFERIKNLDPESETDVSFKSVKTVVDDLKALVTAGESGVTGAGVNWPSDSPAFAAYLKLMADLKTAEPLLREAMADQGEPI